MTAASLCTGAITIHLPRRRVTALRRLALSAALVLLAWSSGRAVSIGHEEQARLLETERAVRRSRERFPYGFVQ